MDLLNGRWTPSGAASPAVLLLFLTAAACSRDADATLSEREGPMTISITSSAFEDGASIPVRYTCDGQDLSPPLSWTGAPEGTVTFALIGDDPDAPVGTWVHWVLYDIPADVAELPEGLPTTPTVLQGARQGRNDFRRIGYGGPCPPRGAPHRYFFKLYALDATLTLPDGAEKKDVVRAMEGHILAQGQLVGMYRRK
ncbi:MAG: YbhB/YbcL family Raf kinase inhibitor-like protein [Gemmatimonadota bacterium]